MPINCSAILQKLNLRLKQCNYLITYIPGKSNYLCDRLSRLPIADSDDDFALLLLLCQSNKVPSIEISRDTEKDSVLTQVRHYVMHGFLPVGKRGHTTMPAREGSTAIFQ